MYRCPDCLDTYCPGCSEPEDESIEQVLHERCNCRACGKFFSRTVDGVGQIRLTRCDECIKAKKYPALIMVDYGEPDAQAKYRAAREANLQRWGLRPQGTGIEVKARRVA
jgi:hypothetical protein